MSTSATSVTAPVIVVHWLENSRSQRILWLLEELKLEYEVKIYKRDTKTMLAGPDLKAIHPLGKSPVITITEKGNTITLAESGAICEFLIERYGNGKFGVSASGDSAESANERANYLYWLHWAEGTAMYPLMLTIVFAQLPKQSPFFIRPLVNAIASQVMSIYVNPKLKANFGFVESSLEGREWLCGTEGGVTGADVLMTFPIEGLESSQGPDLEKNYPNIYKWLKRVRAREAYVKAEERGGKTDLQAFVR